MIFLKHRRHEVHWLGREVLYCFRLPRNIGAIGKQHRYQFGLVPRSGTPMAFTEVVEGY